MTMITSWSKAGFYGFGGKKDSFGVLLLNLRRRNIKPSSCKQKARILQQWVAKQLLANAPALEPGDCVSTSMGAPGEDVKLSPAARKIYPFNLECKSLAKVAVYGFYEQAASHGTYEPVVVIKANHKKPLVVVDAEYFFRNFKNGND